ncbi:DoxX family protein [Candidatus Parcubacteria bacterium]|nr:DoxX family protein [Patescibacteria group bacterium]MCG2694280.1 DoxX family protein [Candidatus Parcubacteria bacterium]
MYNYILSDLGFFVLRFSVGIILIAHGIPKIRTRKAPFTTGWKNLLLGIWELLGGFLLVAGLWMNFVATGLAIEMLGAIYFHILVWKQVFKGGWELPFLIFCALILLALTGGGNWRIII